MVCDVIKIDGSATALYFAEEECIKVLPGVEGADAVWYGLEPNSYADTGGNFTQVSRNPISEHRQNLRGDIGDVEASAGFNIDVTQNNLTRLLQGFFFADARETTDNVSIGSAEIDLTGVTAVDDRYAAASGLGVYDAGMLIYASGFTNSGNNGLKTVASVAAGYVAVSEALVDETPPAKARIKCVGYQFASADVNLSVTTGIPSLTSTTTDFTTLDGVFAGAWVFLGGDTAGTRFANNQGYARVSAVTATLLTFDQTTWTPATESGSGKTIHLFVGDTIRNEQTLATIIGRTYQIERQLGSGATSTQAEYVIGSVPDSVTLNIPAPSGADSKLNVDMSFIGCNVEYRSGDVSDEIKAGTRVATLGEKAFTTSKGIYASKIAINSTTTSNPTSLFGYITDGNIAISNGVTMTRVVGTLGGVDYSKANFSVSGTVTCLFTSTAAVSAIKNNSDCGLYMIAAARNAGMVYDVPLLGINGGKLNVTANEPITLPLENMGYKCANGYTAQYTNFHYLPTLAMPA
jgi:hypothetical protein